MKSKYFLIIVPFLFIACSQKEKEIVFDKPKIQIPKKDPEVRKNKGSLYSMQGSSLFADKKDLQIGDIIQVVISEKLNSTAKNQRTIGSTRTTSLKGPSFTGAGGSTANMAGHLNNDFGLNATLGGNSTDTGTVNTKFDENFSTTISAIIEETYQNGNYYIKGAKEMLVEGQKQKIIVSGVIRPYDITSDNSINSSQIANFKLSYDKDGSEADVMDTPWGTKFIRSLWPF